MVVALRVVDIDVDFVVVVVVAMVMTTMMALVVVPGFDRAAPAGFCRLVGRTAGRNNRNMNGY